MNTKELDTLAETLEERVCAINDGLRERDGKISDSESLYIKNILSSLKNIETIKAMNEGEYSGHGGHYGAFDAGRSYRDEYSMARGRRGAKRDSMGRYSRADQREEMISDLEKLMGRYDDRMYQSKIKELIEQIENA